MGWKKFNFTLVTQDSIGHDLKTLCISVLSLAVPFESEWKRYSSSQSDKKMLAFEYEFSLRGWLQSFFFFFFFFLACLNAQFCYQTTPAYRGIILSSHFNNNNKITTLYPEVGVGYIGFFWAFGLDLWFRAIWSYPGSLIIWKNIPN